MRFSRLSLNGFKSFVDPTDLVIADGLTGVVGPNGCGKSNLLEALRWVMGENRPTAMRGGGMEDVIFAGAQSRPARNFAEVTLALDNADRRAPAIFNDAETLDVVRRITRDVGSAYQVNGREVRARDVQMLFADASTGAHSPSLVRQGQISELINARPQRRRRVLEEAAGISGLYQRRHEAELKLNATEANLARIDDLVDQLSVRLASLSRQARQAARYREIAAALRQAERMLLYRRWREAEAARIGAEETLRRRLGDAAAAERRAILAEDARAAAEAVLPELREEETVARAILQRAHVARDGLAERERQATAEIARLEARIDQIDADTQREGTLNRDAGESIARLEVEAAELGAAGDGQDDMLAGAEAAARDAAAVLREREEELSTLTEDLARLAARHQSTIRVATEVEARVTRIEAEASGARDAAAGARTAMGAEAEAARAAMDAQARLQSDAAAAEVTLAEAETAREAAQDAEGRARADRAGAEGEARTLAAEIAALEKLLSGDDGDGAPLLDRLQVETGFEAALGAALGDDLRASGIGAEETEKAGWTTLPPYNRPSALPHEATPLANRVTAPAALSRALSQVGLVEPNTAERLQAQLRPGQVLVSTKGDLWRWDGFRVPAGSAPSAAALRLRQTNRLVRLRAEHAAAEGRAEATRDDHAAQARRLTEARSAEAAARDARRDTDRALSEAGRRLAQAEGARGTAEARLETARRAVDRLDGELRDARGALQEAEAARRDLPPLDATRAALETLRGSVEGARMAMMGRRAEVEELKRDAEARAKRLRTVVKDLSDWRARLASADTRLGDLTARRRAIGTELEAARGVPASLADERDELAREIARAESRRDAARAARVSGEAAARDAMQAAREAERAAGEAREARARAEARRDAAGETLGLAEARIAEALDCTPAELLDALGTDADTMPSVATVETRVAALRRQRDGLGAVNLRAEEDAREVQVECDQLSTERTDLEQAVGQLRAGIASLNREGRQRLLDAFDTVNENFATLFRHLFQGGEARLELVESDDPLEAGLEILCQPPGKKLSTLSLLSGGEQTLTALALIFAVFLANPAPICVLDEVDAPLDDANVTRFCDMLDEMTRRTSTRFLIITHHAVTMARMDRLFGVTMVEPGVSQLVSVDLRKAETLVA
ncbi:chromosome segregation protein SMC [uncultured Jannaschia sp.]|uniref:chromosome segregation protein SMC n=1 Tax=uncultured Jannaschia sp. TaxID=293347 RepID=UPI00260FDB64|nr:chromosome segregation protein SMC [uncultured Jannaschia sp.]